MPLYNLPLPFIFRSPVPLMVRQTCAAGVYLKKLAKHNYILIFVHKDLRTTYQYLIWRQKFRNPKMSIELLLITQVQTSDPRSSKRSGS